MFGWWRRWRRRSEPLEPVVQILIQGQWQTCRVVGKSGLHLTLVVHDPLTHRYGSVMVQPEACRDPQYAKRLLMALTERGGETLIWEDGSQYVA